jgi:hypothetical protein
MEVDDAGNDATSHSHEQGFCCSAAKCNWASISSRSFMVHSWRNHRHDEPRPTCSPTWVIPMNPNGSRKRYRACCSSQQHHISDEAHPTNAGDEQIGIHADTAGLQSQRKRQKRTLDMISEQQKAQQLGISVITDPTITSRNNINHVGPSDPSNVRALSPFYRKMDWFSENDRFTRHTIFDKQRNLLFFLTQSPVKGIKYCVIVFFFFLYGYFHFSKKFKTINSLSFIIIINKQTIRHTTLSYLDGFIESFDEVNVEV